MIDWREQLTLSADQYSLSLNCTVVRDILMADIIKVTSCVGHNDLAGHSIS